MRKSRILLAMVLFMSIVGCEPAQQLNELESSVAEEQITLLVWVIANSPQAEDIFLQSIDPYLKLHTNLKVKVKVLSWDNAWSDITTAVNKGSGPDILQLGTTWVPAIAAMDGLDKLTDKVDDIGGADAYLPASWKTTMIEGKPDVYAVPWFVEARVFYYRRDVLRAAGVDPSNAFQNWETFKDTLVKVNGIKINGIKSSAFSMSGKSDLNAVHNVSPWIWGAGGTILEADLQTAAFNNERAVEGVMYYTGLARDGLVDPSSLNKNSSQIENDFADGKTAIIVSGSWLLNNLAIPRDEGGLSGVIPLDNIGIAPMPAGPYGQSTFIGGSNLAVFNASKNKQEAWEMIVYLSSAEAQSVYSRKLGMLPARKDLIESPELAQLPGYDAFAKAVEYGESYPSIPEWGPIEIALVKHFGGIWDMVMNHREEYSKANITRRLNEAAREVNIILNQ